MTDLAYDFTPPKPIWQRIGVFDVLFGLILLAGSVYAWQRFHAYMDVYEQVMLFASAAGLAWLGWFWKPFRTYLLACGGLALVGAVLYQGDLTRAESVFWLKYMLSSQSAVMWMCVLFALATLMYWVGLLRRAETADFMGTALCWGASGAALVAMLVRWYESYLIGTDVGHIPVSNLYEVFILFCLMTALMYLYYEARFSARRMGAFVLLVLTSAVGFILWYAFDRQAHAIQPLIPALQSWWMKIHVPANFVGYGAFAIAAMLGVAWLLAEPRTMAPTTRRLFWVLAVVFAGGTLAFKLMAENVWLDLGAGIGFIAKFGYSLAALMVVAANRGRLAGRLPTPQVLDEIAYRAIAIGFLFFTIATILGAMWAADAWGGYWSWDPKETWALIVWLNYAAWLHIRLIKGWRGELLAWWSVAGLFVTSFAFLGVNMFLSGLHSYGKL
jgi:cytochrome c-type biogenesis protein CcsB